MHTPGCNNLAITQVIVDAIKAIKPGILDAAVISLKGFNPFMVEQFENIFWEMRNTLLLIQLSFL
jgi:hypothetical protein